MCCCPRLWTWCPLVPACGPLPPPGFPCSLSVLQMFPLYDTVDYRAHFSCLQTFVGICCDQGTSLGSAEGGLEILLCLPEFVLSCLLSGQTQFTSTLSSLLRQTKLMQLTRPCFHLVGKILENILEGVFRTILYGNLLEGVSLLCAHQPLPTLTVLCGTVYPWN